MKFCEVGESLKEKKRQGRHKLKLWGQKDNAIFLTFTEFDRNKYKTLFHPREICV